MEIKKITDPAFRKYGKILTGIDFTGLVEEMQKTPCPDNVIYEPSIAELEALPVYGESCRESATASCRFRSATATATIKS